MLALLVPTDSRWAEGVERDLDGLLRDHAHCEIKAAQSALSLVARFGAEDPGLVAPLVALAHEETEHFREVHDRITARGTVMSHPGSDEYVASLRRAAGEDRDPQQDPLLDRLLVSSLVEARSCERFKLLSEHLSDGSLRTFYRDLMASEARHFRLFTRLAEERFGETDSHARLEQLARREAAVASKLPLGPTVHG
jgi:tRNA 2-(methylsulfanyl)-N6-isopentenyladenosine37 hydroxylase